MASIPAAYGLRGLPGPVSDVACIAVWLGELTVNHRY
jgi:hypothetical protein